MYNRVRSSDSEIATRIDGVKIWVGAGLIGGNYDGAEKIGTIEYKSGTNPYIFSNLAVRGSSVQIQGGDSDNVLTLAEVEIYPTVGRCSTF